MKVQSKEQSKAVLSGPGLKVVCIARDCRPRDGLVLPACCRLPSVWCTGELALLSAFVSVFFWNKSCDLSPFLKVACVIFCVVHRYRPWSLLHCRRTDLQLCIRSVVAVLGIENSTAAVGGSVRGVWDVLCEHTVPVQYWHYFSFCLRSLPRSVCSGGSHPSVKWHLFHNTSNIYEELISPWQVL